MGVIFNQRHTSWDACLLIILRGIIFILPLSSLSQAWYMQTIHFSHLRATHHFSRKCINFPPILTAQAEKMLSPPTGLTSHLFLSHQDLKRAGSNFWAAHIMATVEHWPCISIFFKGAVKVYYGASIKNHCDRCHTTQNESYAKQLTIKVLRTMKQLSRGYTIMQQQT